MDPDPEFPTVPFPNPEEKGESLCFRLIRTVTFDSDSFSLSFSLSLVLQELSYVLLNPCSLRSPSIAEPRALSSTRISPWSTPLRLELK